MKNLNSKILVSALIGITAITACKKNAQEDTPIEVPNTTETLSNSFFEKVIYRGAFGTTDWTSGWAKFDPKNEAYPATTETLSGNITASRTLDASKVYLLSGFVYVKTGVTLTIPAGTIIRGDKATKATLIITKGAKLVAEGTISKPIVFTSNLPVGSRAAGDWGGIILLGKAQNNIPGGLGTIEGGVNVASDPVGTGEYGGTIATDNSGILKYVRIEFPGVAFQPNNEINGLTLGSVGSGTMIDYVQVSFSGDDSFEWFGGTVNGKHLIAISGTDDDFDFDNGFVGKMQFCVGQKDPKIADQAGQSNGIESDNSATVFVSSPRTQPLISNMTLVGPVANLAALATVDAKHENGNLWRRGSKMILGNSIFIGFKFGIDIRDKQTGDALTDKSSLITNNFYQSYVTGKDVIASGAIIPGDANSGPSFSDVAILKTLLTTSGNEIMTEANSQMLLASPFNLTAPSFVLKAGSAAAAGAKF